MDNTKNIFATLNTEEPVETVPEVKATSAQSGKKAKLKAMEDCLEVTMRENPNFVNQVKLWSPDLEMVNSLGFGDSGNIVLDNKSKKRNLIKTSTIVGYRVKNNGKVPMKYQTEIWKQGEDGKFVAEKAEKVLAPGKTADLTRQYMTMFCAQPEISFTLANGNILRGSASAKNDVKAELEAHYFAFNKEAGDKQVNSDEVKLNVGEKNAAGKWVVKPEFVETFGYLNNPKETNKRGGKGKGKKNTAVSAANYINTLVKNSGAM